MYNEPVMAVGNTEIHAIKVWLSLCFNSQSWKNPLDLGFRQETYGSSELQLSEALKNQ
jgi:hypothetical protein